MQMVEILSCRVGMNYFVFGPIENCRVDGQHGGNSNDFLGAFVPKKQYIFVSAW